MRQEIISVPISKEVKDALVNQSEVYGIPLNDYIVALLINEACRVIVNHGGLDNA